MRDKWIEEHSVLMETVGFLRQKDPRGIELLSEFYGWNAKKMLAARFHLSLNQLELDAAYNGALFKAWNYGHSVDETQNLRAWFFRICINEAINLCKRSAKPCSHDFSQMTSPTDDSGVNQSSEKCSLVASMRAAVEQLPPLQKRILIADMQNSGEANASILAKRFGTSANSIRVSRSKAKHRLRNQLISEFPMYSLAT